MIRTKTFAATQIPPDGVLYAGDVNAIQDAAAGLDDYAQHINLASISIGSSDIQLLKYGTAEARISAALRTDGIVRALGGMFAGNFTTTSRNAIAAGKRPFTLVIFNTTTAQFEYNAGSDVTPNWLPLVASSIADGAVTLAKLASDSVDSSKIVDGSIVAGDINGALKPSVSAAAGTESLRAIGVTGSTAAAGNDARLSDTRTPTDATVTNAKVAVGAAIAYAKLALTASILNADIATGAAIVYSKLSLGGSILASDLNAAIKPSGSAAAGTEALRALGTTASTAAAGNDARLSDTRTPTDNTVSTAKIQAAAVTATQLADGTITYAKWAAGVGYMQRGGSAVVVLDGSSEAAIAFSGAFPTGIITAVAMSGDAAAGTDLIVTLVQASTTVSGIKVHVRASGGGSMVGVTVRINYVALGF